MLRSQTGLVLACALCAGFAALAVLWIALESDAPKIAVATSTPAVSAPMEPVQPADAVEQAAVLAADIPLIPARSEPVAESLSLAWHDPLPSRTVGTLANVVLMGRVVDQAGVPLPRADVLVAERNVAHPRSTRLHTDADGSFAVLDDWLAEELVVRVTHTECWNSKHAYTVRGARDLELPLERYATIVGRLSLGEGVPIEDVKLEIVHEELHNSVTIAPPTHAETSYAIPNEMGRDGSFRVEGLRPGTYTLRALGERNRELASLSGIELKAGDVWRDERCNPWNVRRVRQAPIPLQLQVSGDLPEAPTVLRVAFVPVIEGAQERETTLGNEWTTDLTQFSGAELAEMARTSKVPYFGGADVDSAGMGNVQLPGPGRYRVLWYETTTTSGTGMRLAREVVQVQTQLVNIEAFPSQPVLQLKFERATAHLTTKRRVR